MTTSTQKHSLEELNKIYTKKRILFVDDRTKRIEWAKRELANNHIVTFAYCVPEALRLICRKPFEIIYLDHDLNGHDFQDPDEETCGMQIVRYFEKTGGWFAKTTYPLRMFDDEIPLYDPPEFYIHSSNLFAANLMISRLRAMRFKAYYHPIIEQKDNMKYDENGNPL